MVKSLSYLDRRWRQHDLRVCDESEDAAVGPVATQEGYETSQVGEDHLGQRAVHLQLPERVVALETLVGTTARVPQDSLDLNTTDRPARGRSESAHPHRHRGLDQCETGREDSACLTLRRPLLPYGYS